MKLLTLSTPGGIPLLATMVPAASPVLAATRLIPALRTQFPLPTDVSFSFRDLTPDELAELAKATPA